MISRRELLWAAAMSTTAGGGRLARAAAARPPARACVLLYMAGGPSHIDTFDPKPGRTTGGSFAAIPTAIDGAQFCEHLPRLAERARHLAVVRSLTSKEGNHDRARHLMHTGYPPQGGADHPAFGSLVAESRGGGGAGGMPGYVAVGGPGEDAGFLPATLSPFPVRNATKPVKYLAPARGIDGDRFERRLGLWRTLEDRFAAGAGGAFARSQRGVTEQAVALMRAGGAAAFDLAPEPGALREAYGQTPFGQGCLMARRLVEAGVPFVEVTLGGWDTHENNFSRVKELCGTLDRALGALLDDLSGRGLLSSTLVVWMGDFGRTPRINERGGRDHFPAASSLVLAGGGVRGGQVIGATDRDGAEVRERPVTVPDLYRTLCHLVGVDADKLRMAPSGRPIKTVDGGTIVRDLV